MLKCIAIDDEPLALRQLKSYIEKIPYLELTATCNNALEAQQLLASQHVDLIFVDINMPDLSGVEFVRSLVDRPMVISRRPTRNTLSKGSSSTPWITCSNPSALPTSAARRGKPIRSTNCATTSVLGNPRPLPKHCQKTRNTSP